MSLSPRETRCWSMLCHLSALAMLIFSWGAIIGPLVMWLLKRNESSEVDEQGKESLNFQITIFILTFILSVIIGIIEAGTFSLGFGMYWGSPFAMLGLGNGFGLYSLLSLIRLIDIILVVVASVQAYNGGFYKYPFTFRLIK